MGLRGNLRSEVRQKTVKWLKILTSGLIVMYRKENLVPNPLENFELPWDGKLAEDNRWVRMAKLIPWSEFEEEYAQNFTKERGAPAKSFRMALGALIIKEKLGTSDRETVEQIRENRVNLQMVKKLREETTASSSENNSDAEESSERKNRGKLLLDATCASADIRYPTDLGLLNQVREHTEKIIDIKSIQKVTCRSRNLSSTSLDVQT
jgi:transposase, IS5 family